MAWVKATDEFRRLYARSMAGSSEHSESFSTSLKLLLIQRARIVKSARAKIPMAAQVLAGAYQKGQRWIVYCDDRSQLAAIKQSITSVGGFGRVRIS